VEYDETNSKKEPSARLFYILMVSHKKYRRIKI